MHVIDRAALSRVSRDLAQAGAEVRDLGTHLRSGARSLDWRGPAAAAFESALGGLLGQLARLSGRLDDTAVAVAAHGERAAQRASLIGQAGESAAHAVERLVRRR